MLTWRLAGARQVLALLTPVFGRTRALVGLETLAPATAAALTAYCNMTSLKQIKVIVGQAYVVSRSSPHPQEIYLGWWFAIVQSTLNVRNLNVCIPLSHCLMHLRHRLHMTYKHVDADVTDLFGRRHHCSRAGTRTCRDVRTCRY